MRIRRIINKIKKIIDYIPILWNDEDWDFEYLLLLLRFKLNRIKDCIHKNDIIVKQEQREIFIGINQTIDHINNYLKDYEGYEEDNQLPFNYEYRSESNSNGTYRMVIYNIDENRPLNDEEDSLYTQHLLNANKWLENEWSLIFDTIKREGQKWWE